MQEDNQAAGGQRGVHRAAFLEHLYGVADSKLPEGLVAVLMVAESGHDRPSHYLFDDLRKMDEAAARHAAREEVTGVFHSVSLFAKPPKGAKFSRRGEHAVSSSVIAIDLDVGEGKAYRTRGEAVEAAKRVIPEVLGWGLDRFVIASSGAGVHLYLPTACALSRDVWEFLAGRFKQALLRAGLRLDRSVTGDIARVMRTPETLNRKPEYPEPLPAKCVYLPTRRIDPDELRQRLDEYEASRGLVPLQVPSREKRRDINDDALGYVPMEETPENVALVRSALAAINPDCGFEVWREVVWGVLSTGWSCAEDLAREWSMGVLE